LAAIRNSATKARSNLRRVKQWVHWSKNGPVVGCGQAIRNAATLRREVLVKPAGRITGKTGLVKPDWSSPPGGSLGKTVSATGRNTAVKTVSATGQTIAAAGQTIAAARPSRQGAARPDGLPLRNASSECLFGMPLRNASSERSSERCNAWVKHKGWPEMANAQSFLLPNRPSGHHWSKMSPLVKNVTTGQNVTGHGRESSAKSNVTAGQTR
jgi:hypothetical protein